MIKMKRMMIMFGRENVIGLTVIHSVGVLSRCCGVVCWKLCRVVWCGRWRWNIIHLLTEPSLTADRSAGSSNQKMYARVQTVYTSVC